jgi:hypothetical protein
LANLVTAAVELAFGLWLLLGAQGLVQMLERVRGRTADV